MSGLGPEASAFLEAARNGDEPSQVDAQRVRAAIATKLATGAGGVAAGVGAAQAARSWLVRSGTMVPVAVALVVGVSVGVRIAAQRASGSGTLGSAKVVPSPPLVPADAPSAWGPNVAKSLPAPVAPSLDAPTTRARPGALGPSASVGASGSSPHGGAGTGDVAAEVRLLVEAHRAMDSGDATRALVLLEEHARRFPRGALGEERDATRVGALCALGRSGEAREATERFLRGAPHSPLAGPLRTSCGGSPASPASSVPPL